MIKWIYFFFTNSYVISWIRQFLYWLFRRPNWSGICTHCFQHIIRWPSCSTDFLTVAGLIDLGFVPIISSKLSAGPAASAWLPGAVCGIGWWGWTTDWVLVLTTRPIPIDLSRSRLIRSYYKSRVDYPRFTIMCNDGIRSRVSII